MCCVVLRHCCVLRATSRQTAVVRIVVFLEDLGPFKHSPAQPQLLFPPPAPSDTSSITKDDDLEEEDEAADMRQLPEKQSNPAVPETEEEQVAPAPAPAPAPTPAPAPAPTPVPAYSEADARAALDKALAEATRRQTEELQRWKEAQVR